MSLTVGTTVTVQVAPWLARQQELASRILTGTVEAVTPRAVRLAGHATIRPSDTCHRCGRAIDHPASRLIGYGPICADHLGLDWVSKAASLTPEQIAAIRASVERDHAGSWWLPLSAVTIEGTPLAPRTAPAATPRTAVVQGAQTELAWAWGDAAFGEIKDAVKQAGGRWNPDQRCWTLATVRALPLAERYGFAVTGEVPTTVELPPRLARRTGPQELALSWERHDPDFAALLAAVRALPVRWYDVEARLWLAQDGSDLRGLLSRYHFRLDPSVEEGAPVMSRDALIAASRQAEADYDLGFALPPGLAPYPYQLAYIQYAEAVGGKLICADEMGLGKTVESLLANHKLGGYPLVVVCPASVVLNWQREFNRWLPDVSTAVIKGRTKLVPQNVQVYITNYESLSTGIEKIGARNVVKLSSTGLQLAAREPQGLIVDEAHYCKTAKAARTRAVLRLAATARVRQALSGTPIPNRVEEIKPQLQITGLLDQLGGGLRFDRTWVYSSAEGRLGRLNDTLRGLGYVRRLKSQVKSDLPAKTQTQLLADWRADLTYNAAYDELVSAYYAHEQGAQLAALTKMRAQVGLCKVEPTLEFVDNFLAESSGKLVITAHHQEVQQALYTRLQASYPQLGIARLFSSDSMTVRQREIDRFQQDPNTRLIVLSLRAGGIGITLTAASTLLHVEQDWVPATMAQASDRIHRDGQTEPVTIYDLLANGSVDTLVLDAQARKLPEIEAATQGQTAASSAVQHAVIEALVAARR